MGNILGQYEYDEDRGCYVQTSTNQSNEQNRYIKMEEERLFSFLTPKYTKMFLYRRDEDDMWVVGSSLGGNQTLIMSKELLTGWIFYDGQSWHLDPSLTVTPGPLPPLPSQFTVTASGAAAEEQPASLGVFNKTEGWWMGRPVYVNTEGQLLYHETSWMIGPELGWYTLRGQWSHQSPACERNWTYVAYKIVGVDEKPASVKIVSGAGELFVRAC